MSSYKRVFAGIYNQSVWPVLAFILVGCTSGFQADPSLKDLSSESPTGSGVYGLDFLMQEKNRGRALYTQNCQICHLPIDSSVKAGRKAEEITRAIASVSQMRAISINNADAFALELALTSQTLSAYLTDPRVPIAPSNPTNPTDPVNPNPPGEPTVPPPPPPPPPLTDLTCQPGSDPSPTYVTRLSKNQLKYAWANLNLIGLRQLYSSEILDPNRSSSVAFSLVPDDYRSYNSFTRQDQTVTSFHVDAHLLTALVGGDEFSKLANFPDYSCMNAIDTATVTCIKDFVRGTGLIALRRPLSTTEVDDYYGLLTQGTSRREGLKMVMAAFALAPQTMFQIEVEGQLKDGSSDVLQLTDYEIAARLALAVSGRPPSAAMYQAAAAGRFSNPTTFAEEVDALYSGIDRATRWPADDTTYGMHKVQQTYRQFSEEWLHLDREPAPLTGDAIFEKFGRDDPNTYTTWTFASHHLFGETHELIHRQFWNGGNFAKLLTDREFFSAGDHIYGVYGYIRTRTNICAYRYARAIDFITPQSNATFTDRFLRARFRTTPGGPVQEGELRSVPAGSEIVAQETVDAQNRIKTYTGTLVEALINDYYRNPSLASLKEAEHVCNSDYEAHGSAKDRVYTHDSNRAGLLTRAGMLYQPRNDTNPISRGVFIRRQILCDELDNPDADKLPDRALEPPAVSPDLTTRERYTAKTSPALCMSCHKDINPLGFALEDFDTLGRKRTTENIYSLEIIGNDVNVRTLRTLPIDASVSSLELTTNDGLSANGAVAMSQALAVSPKANACFARQVFRFMFARKETTGDACMISNMYENLTSQSGSFERMFKGFARHEHFRLRKVGPQQ